MSTVNKFGAARLLDPSNATLDGQSRVNAEIFTAVEMIGRKLERVEAERDRLAQRLALIESNATVDEKTGKLYLPVVMEGGPLPSAPQPTPKWMIASSMMSSAIALFALGMVMFREPAPALTKDQVALLEQLKTTQFTQLSPESKSWKSLDSESTESASTAPVTPTASAPAPVAAASSTTAPVPLTAAPPAQVAAVPAPPQQPPSSVATVNAPAAQLPSSSELASLEKMAQAPKPVEAATAPVPSTEPPPLSAAEKAETVSAAAANPDNVVIPGEDDTPDKTADKDKTGKDKTATVVPTSAGAGGLAPDAALPKTLAKLQKRAYQGIPEAQHDLATLYAAGTAVPQDYHRAAFWFTKAAEGGIANAYYNMGVIYHQGLGVPVDMAKALDWYAKAAELGHPEAMYNLGIAYIEGIGTKVDIDKGVSYFRRASKAGVVQAAYNLGVLYESNFIGPIDTKKAMEWYKVAAKAGHAQARDALARLQSAGPVVADSGDQAQTLANKVEPSTGGDEETGEGDSSPVTEQPKPAARHDAPHSILSDIQRVLIKQGVLPGQPDGVLNQQTEDAIRSAEKKLSMTEDGEPSQELLEKLLQAPPPSAEKPFP